jgi:uncharacterized membrane protein
MNVRTLVTRAAVAAAVLGSVLAVSAAPASAATGHTIVDAGGVVRGGYTVDAQLINLCDWSADGVTLSVEFTFANGTSAKRIAPLGGCTSAFGWAGPIVAARGFANDFANAWQRV